MQSHLWVLCSCVCTILQQDIADHYMSTFHSCVQGWPALYQKSPFRTVLCLYQHVVCDSCQHMLLGMTEVLGCCVSNTLMLGSNAHVCLGAYIDKLPLLEGHICIVHCTNETLSLRPNCVRASKSDDRPALHIKSSKAHLIVPCRNVGFNR